MSKARLGRKRSIEVRRNISLAKKGSNNPAWRGGISSLNARIRRSQKYKRWREKVFERDNYTCTWCNARNGNGKSVTLNADHIKPFALYPKLRFDINNGRTLCLECHKKTDTYKGKIIKYAIQINFSQ